MSPEVREAFQALRRAIDQLEAALEGASAPRRLCIPPHNARFEVLLKASAEHWGVSVDALLSHSLVPAAVGGRQVVSWVACRTLGMSSPQVGRLLDRDHSSVLASVRRVDSVLASEPDGPLAKAVRAAEVLALELLRD